jgi:hypothetical protein
MFDGRIVEINDYDLTLVGFLKKNKLKKLYTKDTKNAQRFTKFLYTLFDIILVMALIFVNSNQVLYVSWIFMFDGRIVAINNNDLTLVGFLKKKS